MGKTVTAVEILISLIKEFEGCKLKAYQCPAGIWTIGYGYTHGVKKGDVWTQKQADEKLLSEALSAIDMAIKSSPGLKDETIQRQAAIADFIYNLGIGNYKISTLKLRVDQGLWQSAETECKRWNKANGKILAGLTARREKEAKLLLS